MNPSSRQLLVIAAIGGSIGFLDGARLFGQPLSSRLLIDLNSASSPLGSAATDFASLPGVVVFSADDAVSGRELWRTDGTPAGTYRLPESCEGPCSQLGRHLWVEGGAAFYESAAGRGLRVTAGTAATTLLLDDDLRVADSPHAADCQGRVYFVVRASEGEELWITDRTAAGTRRLLAPTLGMPSAGYSDFAVFEGRLYFAARRGSQPPAIWVSDGTVTGTRRLVAGTSFLEQRAARVLGATRHGVVLRLWTSHRGSEAWAVDAGNRLRPLGQLSPGSASPRWLWWRPAGGGVLVAVSTPQIGEEVWSIDPKLGVRRLTDWSFFRAIRMATAGPPSFDWSGGRVLFPVRERAESLVTSLWLSDGTPGGTRRLGDGAVLGVHTDPPYFLAELPAQGPRLVRVGAEGLRVVADSASAAQNRNFVTVRDEVVFTTFDGIWGTREGGQRATLLQEREYPTVVAAVGGRALGIGSTAASGNEPFSLALDGTGSVFDVNQTSAGNGSSPRGFSVFGGSLGPERALFAAFGSDGFGLWTTDGTAADTWRVRGESIPGNLATVYGSATTTLGTFLVLGRTGFRFDPGEGHLYFVDATLLEARRLNPSGTFVAHRAPMVVGERVIFTACDATGCEPWVTDGSPASTRQVADLLPGMQSSGFVALGVSGDDVLGWASVPGAAALWRTDGSAAGTRPAVLSTAGVFPSIATIGDQTYFLRGPNPAQTSCGALELRRVGEVADTEQLVAVLDAEFCGSWAVSVAQVHDRLVVFDLSTGPSGLTQRVWVSDGTFVGTEWAAEIPTDGFSGFAPTVTLGRAFFTAGPSGAHVLWSSTGTLAGTGPHDDIVFGPGERYLQGLVGFRGRVVVQVGDDQGTALWEADGLPDGTRRIVAGELVGHPIGGRLYFAGRDEHGIEPWVLESLP